MRLFRRAALWVMGLFVVWIVLVLGRWAPPTTDVQQKALAILVAPETRATGQHNAFEALYLAGYDIPEADRAKVLADDLARYGNGLPANDADVFVTGATGRYRKIAPSATDPAFCKLQEEGCLARVRGNAEAIRKLLGERALLVDQARGVDAADYYHDPFPESPQVPLPNGLIMGSLRITDAALRFADGDKAEGMARACAAAATWKRLSTHADNLIVKMVGIAIHHGAADLFADMLAEVPADAPLPPACTEAFAPVADADLDMCDAMKHEFRLGSSVLDHLQTAGASHVLGANGSAASDFLVHLLTNPRATKAMMAVEFAPRCSADPDIAKEAARMRTAEWSDVGGWLGAVFNPVGGVVVTTYTADYDSYAIRMHDIQRMDDLVRTALSLREQAAASRTGVDAKAAALPKGIAFDAAKGELHSPRAYARADYPADFSIPLPASRVH